MSDYDARLVGLYDQDNPDGPDHDFYRSLADEHGARSVLDVGCGTGLLTTTFARAGRHVVGLDPSETMLDFARRRPGGQRIDWILGDTRALPPGRFNLAVLTGNVAQHILDPEWQSTLRDLHQQLGGGGVLAFDSRNPRTRAWEIWASQKPSFRDTQHGALVEWACAALSVPVAYFLGGLTLWHLLLVAAVVSVSDVFFTTAQSAAIPLLLKGDKLSHGYAKIQSMQSGIAIATPGVVGLIARAVAAPAVLVIAGTAYLASAVVTSRLPLAVSSHPERPGKFWVEARAGLGFVWRHPLIRPLMISVALVNAAGMAGAAAKVVYALEVLDIPVDQFVGIGSVSALGGLAASLSATRITCALGIGKTKITASLASAGFVLLLPAAPLLGLSPVAWVGISGFGWSYFVVVSGLAGAGIIPRLASHSLMGRVMATYRLVTLGVMPVASLAGGALATYLGVTAALWVWALVTVAAAVPIVLSPLRSWTEFPVELDVHAREGEVGSSAPAQ